MTWTSFKPGKELTFNTAHVERAALFEALMAYAGDVFCLDLSEVGHCDSAGLALLIEARKLCLRANKQFVVTGMPNQMLSLAEFCGVKPILEVV